MALSLITLSNSFLEHILRTDDIITYVNGIMNANGDKVANTAIEGTLFNLVSNTGAVAVTNQPSQGNTVYISIGSLATNVNDQAIANVASSNLVNQVYNLASYVVFSQANTARNQANAANTLANTALTVAKSAYDSSNTGLTNLSNATNTTISTVKASVNVANATANSAAAFVSSVVGSMMMYAGNTAPSKWLLCYGQSISRTTYSSLFSVIGTTFGSANSSVFSVPDMRGRVAAGVDNMGGVAAGRISTSEHGGLNGQTLGSTGGANTVVLTVANLAPHTHKVDPAAFATSGTEGGHSHSWSGSVSGSVTGGTHKHNISSLEQYNNMSGGGGRKAPQMSSESGGESGTLETDNGTHTHSWSGSVSGSVSGSGTHTHTINVPATDSTANGSGTAHTNIQPTIMLNYIIYTGV